MSNSFLHCGHSQTSSLSQRQVQAKRVQLSQTQPLHSGQLQLSASAQSQGQPSPYRQVSPQTQKTGAGGVSVSPPLGCSSSSVKVGSVSKDRQGFATDTAAKCFVYVNAKVTSVQSPFSITECEINCHPEIKSCMDFFSVSVLVTVCPSSSVV